MAASKDKDDAYEALTSAVKDAFSAGMSDSQIVTDVENVVTAADSAANITRGLKNWIRRK